MDDPPSLSATLASPVALPERQHGQAQPRTTSMTVCGHSLAPSLATTACDTVRYRAGSLPGAAIPRDRGRSDHLAKPSSNPLAQLQSPQPHSHRRCMREMNECYPVHALLGVRYPNCGVRLRFFLRLPGYAHRACKQKPAQCERTKRAFEELAADHVRKVSTISCNRQCAAFPQSSRYWHRRRQGLAG